jgi:hypothetical protein
MLLISFCDLLRLNLPMPPASWQLRTTKAEILVEIDRLLERCTDSEVAAELNKKGWRSSENLSYTNHYLLTHQS